jgi:hypothetical protein
MQRKDDIEAELVSILSLPRLCTNPPQEDLRNTLRAHNAGPETSLIDPEGYPRSDIDIVG